MGFEDVFRSVKIKDELRVLGKLTGNAAFSALKGNVWYVDAARSASGDGRSWSQAFMTIQEAVDAASANDMVLVAPGSYDETVAVDVAGLTFMGCGNRGTVAIEPSGAGAEGMQVTADDVTLYNMGVAGDDTSSYALNVSAAARFRAYECKFEGPTGVVVLMSGSATDQAADALFEDCEFCWGGSGMRFQESAYGYPTQMFLKNCRFHNLTDACLDETASGAVADLHVTGCYFGNAEDGTAPTDYVKIDNAASFGLMANNFFATATNDTAVITIGAGIKYMANATEAGFSTARPA